jgi:alpha-galactosidase
MAAHVSGVPNHQVGRVTPLSVRAAVAFFGVLGYELDPTTLTDDERRQVKAQVAYYVARRDLFQRGRFLRLLSPFEGDGNRVAWMTVMPNRSRAVVGHYQVLSRPNARLGRLRLRGLDPSRSYRVTEWRPQTGESPAREAGSDDESHVHGGDELMQAGLVLDDEDPRRAAQAGDFRARLFDLVAESP